MPDSGTDLGVDLYNLWVAGHDELPLMAGAFADANNKLAATSGAASAFYRQMGIGDPYGEVMTPWSLLRDELQTLLADMSRNLTHVGEALRIAAHEFARIDATAAAEFHRRQDLDPNPSPPPVPPLQYPLPAPTRVPLAHGRVTNG